MCANDNVLNAFIPLIRELVHYISKREYDRIDIFCHKNGALDAIRLQDEIESYIGNSKILPLDEEKLGEISYSYYFSPNVIMLHLPVYFYNKGIGKDYFVLGLQCSFIEHNPVVKVFEIGYF